MFVSGFFGFIMGFVAGLQVKHTSPITHNISGVAKACCQTVIAVIFWHQIKTALWWASTMFVLFGTAGYSEVKSLEMKRAHESSQKVLQSSQQVQQNVVHNLNATSLGQKQESA
jgi:GDP-fucose transporter C1